MLVYSVTGVGGDLSHIPPVATKTPPPYIILYSLFHTGFDSLSPQMLSQVWSLYLFFFSFFPAPGLLQAHPAGDAGWGAQRHVQLGSAWTLMGSTLN